MKGSQKPKLNILTTQRDLKRGANFPSGAVRGERLVLEKRYLGSSDKIMSSK